MKRLESVTREENNIVPAVEAVKSFENDHNIESDRTPRPQIDPNYHEGEEQERKSKSKLSELGVANGEEREDHNGP